MSKIITPSPVIWSGRYKDAGVQRLLDNPKLGVGSDPDPTARHIAADATLIALSGNGYGSELAIDGAGTNPDLGIKTAYHGSNDLGFKTYASKFYKRASYCDVTTGSLVVETLIKTTANGELIGTRTPGSYEGWMLYTYASNTRIALFCKDSSANTVDIWTAYVPGTFVHVVSVLHAGNNGITYINGIAGTPVDCSSLGNIAGSDFFIGDGGVDLFSYFCMWEPTLSTHDLQSVVADRFALLTDAAARKSWNGVTLPTITRDSAAYLYRVEGGATGLYLVGKNHPRIVEKMVDGVGMVKGYLGEEQKENLHPYSTTLNSLSDTNLTIVANADTSVTPNAESFQTDVTDGEHYILANMTLTAESYVQSIYARHNSGIVTRLAMLDGTLTGTITNGAIFDLSNGTVISTGATISNAGVIDTGKGEYRLWAVFTGYAGGNELRFYLGDNAGNWSFAGTGAVDQYLRGAQVELGIYPSSLIETAGAAVTRSADLLSYNISSLSTPFTVRGSFVMPTFTPSRDHILFLAKPSSGSAYIVIYVSATSGNFYCYAYDGAGHECYTSPGAVNNDKLTRFQVSLTPEKLIVQMKQHDDVAFSQSQTTGISLSNLTTAYVGSNNVPTYHFGPGIICDLELFRGVLPSIDSPPYYRLYKIL